MSLSRDAIVDHLQQIVGDEQVLTDEQLLQQRSIDNFRKLQNIFGVYTMPLPAAVVMVHSTDEVSKVLAFADSTSASTWSPAPVAPRPRAGWRLPSRTRSSSTARR